MRKLLMTVATALVLLGASVSTKAASLLRGNEVSISADNDNSLVLKHASQLFEKTQISVAAHGSHASHSSHSSHASHYSSK